MTAEQFTETVERSGRRIYLLALAAVKNPADAEDVMQNTFVKLWREQKPFESTEHVEKWLTRVAVNKMITGSVTIDENE